MSVRLEGFKEFGDKFRRLSGGGADPKINAIVYNAATEWRFLATKSAPNRKTKLVHSITADLKGNGIAEVTANVLYSPYVEWGTINKVSVPANLSQYAIQFKGRGIRKNGGNTPKPFFFIHMETIRKKLIRDLKDILK